MTIRFGRRFRALGMLLGVLACGGGSGGGSGPYVQTAPPPLRAEVVPAGPGPQHVWVPGYWGWSGAAYTWSPGGWVLPTPGFHSWVPSSWVHHSQGWQMVQGQWR